MVAIPKISLGISKKRNYFDKSHNYNGTAEFGFCMPTLFDDIEANTKIHLKTNAFVRLGNMPQPSFAPINMKIYNRFIPIDEVYEAYKYQVASQSVTSVVTTYVPKEFDNVFSFSQLLLGSVMWNLIEQFDNSATLQGAELLFIPCLWKVSKGQSSNPVTIVDDTDAYLDVAFNTMSMISKNGWIQQGDKLYFRRAINYGKHLHEIGHDQYFEGAYSSTTIGKYTYMVPEFENADFTFKLQRSSTNDDYRFITLHLTHDGKRLFKVLQCIGYQFGVEKKVSILPLLAYYKAWFDTFNPHRNVQWRQTNAYKVIHSYYDLGLTLSHLLSEDIEYEEYFPWDKFYGMLCHDIPSCCYTLAVDPFTVALNNPVEGNNNEYSLYSPLDIKSNVGVCSYSNFPPSTSESVDCGPTLRLLQKFIPLINKNSVIGARVDKFLQVHYGVSLPQNYDFGKEDISVNVSDVYASAGTTGANATRLGDVAAAGKKYNAGKTHTFEAPTKGFVFQFSVIVPSGSYSQGMNPLLCNLENDSLYLSEFDGLGMAPLTKSSIFATRHYFTGTPSGDTTFGFVPRLMEYKYKNNVRAGGFANRSEINYFLPYQLDRFFTEADKRLAKLNSTEYVLLENTDVTLRNDESLRYIGNVEAFGNYNRIFADQRGQTDNFIVQFVQEYSMYAPMLPISESFDTFDNDGLRDDDGHLNVSHA